MMEIKSKDKGYSETMNKDYDMTKESRLTCYNQMQKYN